MVRNRLGTTTISQVRCRILATLALLALAIGVLGQGIIATGSVAAQSPEAGSVAGIETLAQGPIPGSIGTNVAWRVVQDEAEPAGVAQDEARALGFAVASQDPIRLINPITGDVRDLQPGEASFVIDDAKQRRESLTADTVPYDRIALVPADEASDPGGDTLVTAGDPFELRDPRDDVEVRAFGGTVGAEPISVNSPWPMLLLVLEGSITLLPEDVGVQLEAGEASVLSNTLGDFRSGFVATGGEARFVVASILAPEEPGFSTWSSDSVNASFTVSACPPGVPVADVGENPGSAGPLCGGDPSDTGDPGSPVAGAIVDLTNTDTGETFTGEGDADGRVSFTDLPSGTYEAVFPDGEAAATRCYTAAIDNVNGPIYNIAAAPVLLDSGWIMSCRVVLGAPPES